MDLLFSIQRALLAVVSLAVVQGVLECTYESCDQCLPDAKTTRNNLTLTGFDGNPYSVPFRIARGELWDSQVMAAQIVGILVQEKFGINVEYVVCPDERHCTYATANCIGWQHLACGQATTAEEVAEACSRGDKLFCDEAADIMYISETNQAYTEAASFEGTDFNFESREFVVLGNIGFLTRDGIFTFGDIVEATEMATSISLAWFKSLTSAENRLFLHSPQQLIDDNVSSQDAGCISSSGYVETAMENHRRLGWSCSDAWWLNRECAALGPAWKSECVVLLEDDWSVVKPFIYEGLVNYSVPVAKLMVGYDVWYELVHAHAYNVTFTYWRPDAQFLSQNPIRMQLDEEIDDTPLSAMSAAWDPSYQADSSLQALLNKLRMSDADMRRLMQSTSEAYEEGHVGGSQQFYQMVACRWLRANHDVWTKWLPNPRSCSTGSAFSAAEGMCLPCAVGSHGQRAANATTSCQLCSKGRYAGITGMSECMECEPGSFQDLEGTSRCQLCAAGRSQTSVGQSRCEDCAAGRMAADSGAMGCMMCSEGTSAGAAASRCEVCEMGRYAAGMGIEECTTCPAGLVTTGQGSSESSSCVCPEGTYLALGAHGPRNIADCAECPVYMVCPAASNMNAFVVGQGVLRLLPGYMTLPGEPEQVYACIDQGACPGGTSGECGSLRNPASVACGDCLPAAHHSSDGCEQCDGVTIAGVTVLILAVVAALVLPGVFALMANRDLQHLSLRSADTAVIVSIAVTSIQAMGILGQLPIGWFEPVASLLKVCGFINLDLQVLRVSCFFHVPNAVSYMVDLSPIWLGLVSAMIALSLKKCRVARMDLVSEYVNAVGGLGVMLFVSITIACLKPLICYYHPQGGLSSVRSVPSVLCFHSGQHGIMMACGLIGLLVCPLPFVAFAVFMTWLYPRTLASNPRLLQATRFLFYKYKATRYYYGLLQLTRSFAICLVPVVLRSSTARQCVMLGFILCLSGQVQQALSPWRARLSNILDGALSLLVVCLLLCGTMASNFDAELDSLSSMGTAAFGTALGLGAVALIRAFLLTVFKRKAFDFFLCHHKADAGAQARLLKMLLDGRGTTKSFLDSDHLFDLDTLFDTVKVNVLNLVVLLTQATLTRPWCVGEIATACIHTIKTSRLIGRGFAPPTPENFAQLDGYIDLSSCSLTRYGITSDLMEQGLRWLLSDSVRCLELEVDLPPWTTYAAACQWLVAFSMGRQDLLGRMSTKLSAKQPPSRSRSGLPSNRSIMLSADNKDDEAGAALGILRIGLLSRLCFEGYELIAVHHLASDESAEDLVQMIVSASVIAVVLTAGTLQSTCQLRLMVSAIAAQEAGPSQSLAGANLISMEADTSLVVIPLSTPGFRFPSESFLKESLPPTFYQSDSVGLPQLRRFFRLIAMAVSPNDSRSILEAQTGTLCARIQASTKKSTTAATNDRELRKVVAVLFKGSTQQSQDERQAPPSEPHKLAGTPDTASWALVTTGPEDYN